MVCLGRAKQRIEHAIRQQIIDMQHQGETMDRSLLRSNCITYYILCHHEDRNYNNTRLLLNRQYLHIYDQSYFRFEYFKIIQE